MRKFIKLLTVSTKATDIDFEKFDTDVVHNLNLEDVRDIIPVTDGYELTVCTRQRWYKAFANNIHIIQPRLEVGIPKSLKIIKERFGVDVHVSEEPQDVRPNLTVFYN